VPSRIGVPYYSYHVILRCDSDRAPPSAGPALAEGSEPVRARADRSPDCAAVIYLPLSRRLHW